MQVVASLVFLLVNASPPGAVAQIGNDLGAQESDGSRISVYLVTMGPGKHVWEPYGHNAIWITDTSHNIDRAYNYGVFDFEQEGFLYRFLKGRMLYKMVGEDATRHLQRYIADNRSVWVQELSLTPPQRVELRDFLEWNDRPENRSYRYHYYHDNCSTRIRDALDRVLDGAILHQSEGKETGHTFRFHTQRLNSHNLWMYTGLMLGLAQPVDRQLSAWDEMFLPLKLRQHLRNVVVLDESGNEQPLVLSEQTMYESTQFVESAAPPSWTLRFLGVGLTLAFVALLLAHKATEGRAARIVFSGFTMTWYTLIGVAGLGLAGLWMFTDHDTSYRNENLFWFNPVAILLILLAPLLIFRVQWSVRAGRLAAVFVAGVSLLGFVLQVVPGMDQVNGPLIAVTTPPNLAFAAGLLWYSSIEESGD
jgi:hypothetical protein